MSEVIFENERLISSSRAARLSGYSQDYITQLCRSGDLECERIAEQWYVDADSLRMYIPGLPDKSTHMHDGAQHEHHKGGGAKNTHQHTEGQAQAYSMKVADVRSGAFRYDGKDYIDTQKAAELSGYSQDYVGQLARSSEVVARKVGRRWYVARKDLLEHKDTKDAMLRAVQADASGVENKEDGAMATEDTAAEVVINKNFDLKYIDDESAKPLIPVGAKDIKSPANTHLGHPRSAKGKESSPQLIAESALDSLAEETGVERETTFNIMDTANNTNHSNRVAIVMFCIFIFAPLIVFALIQLGLMPDVIISFVETYIGLIEANYDIDIPSKVLKYSN